MRLENKIAIVTGGGRGIGRDIALAFAKEGARVVVNDIDPTTSEATAAEAASGGSKCIGVAADIAQPGDIAQLIDTTIAEFGRIDIIVNNAMKIVPGKLEELSEAAWDTTMRRTCNKRNKSNGGASMRNVVAALCAFVLLGSASPQAQEIPRPAKAAKPYRVGVLEPNMSVPHFVAQSYGFVDEAQQLGMRVLLYDAGEHRNVHRQVTQMEDLIANRVDAIVLVPGTTVTAMAQIDHAVAAGIPVINVNIMSDNPKVLGRIRSDDYEMGRQQGQFTVEKLKGQGNVVMLSGPAGNSAMIFRAKGFRDYVANHPGIKILSEQWTPTATDRGIKVVEDWNQTFPKIDAVFCGADRLAIGAAQAFKAQGRKPGDVIITTVDYNDDTERFIVEGWISAAMAQTPVLMGRWGMRAALLAIEKKPVPNQVYTPTYVITKDNTDKVDISTIRQPKGWRPPLL